MERIVERSFADWLVSLKKQSIVQIFLASLLIGLLAQIKIPLFFTPVPITGQTLAIMLVAAALGCKKGSLAVLCYLAEGCLGLPVWAGGGFGILALAGPTGGYFLGFILQAFLIGLFLERQRPHLFFAFFLPGILQLGIGSLWLAQWTGWTSALLLGFVPFIPGELLKIAIATSYYKKLHEKRFSLQR